MVDFTKAFKKVLSDAQVGNHYSAVGKRICCPHCDSDRFVKGRAQLNTSLMTFFDLDWANKSATTLTCVMYGNILWFSVTPAQEY